MLEWKWKTVLESLKDFLQYVQNIFSIFFFVLYIENEKKTNAPPPLPRILGGVLVPLAP